ncbi:putative endonuclease lcl3 [Allomyces arbusculus]|nr:putative endonuclease lcl3 [Allomyces arbusculus]
MASARRAAPAANSSSAAFSSQNEPSTDDYLTALATAEQLVEDIAAAQRLLADLDGQRTANREALTHLRKASTPKTKGWMDMGGMLVRLETPQIIQRLLKDQETIDEESTKARNTIQAKFRELERLQQSNAERARQFELRAIQSARLAAAVDLWLKSLSTLPLWLRSLLRLLASALFAFLAVAMDSAHSARNTAVAYAAAYPNLATALGVGVVAGVVALGFAKRNNTLWTRFNTAGEIPLRAPAKGTTSKPLRLRGYAVSVGDSDGFRFYHTPTLRPFTPSQLPGRLRNKDVTISVRLAGVDCPEAAHFGMTAQPYSYEAMAYTVSRLLPGATVRPGAAKFARGTFSTAVSQIDDNQSRRSPTVGGVAGYVQIDVFRRDQYDRAVAMVWYRPYPVWMPWYWRNLSLDLLKEGLAVVYRQAGAEYGGMKEAFEKEEAKAKRVRRGLWSKPHLASPAEHKRAHRDVAGN